MMPTYKGELPILAPSDILRIGLQCLQIHTNANHTLKWKNATFLEHYGSDTLVLADIWHDLLHTDIPAAMLLSSECNFKGLRFFFIAHYYLWFYPKNSKSVSTRFQISKRYTRGVHLWKWITKIAILRQKKIVWDKSLDSGESEIYILAVDGTDCKVFEKKYFFFNQDKKQFTKKRQHGGLKYEIAMSIRRPKVLWLNGPYCGGMNDLSIFNDKLRAKIKPWKRGIADLGYPGTQGVLSLPNWGMDSKEFNRFKTRARLRLETFNGRMKKIEIVNHMFCHSQDKFKDAFEAVALIIQYQMDNGRPVFDV